MSWGEKQKKNRKMFHYDGVCRSNSIKPENLRTHDVNFMWTRRRENNSHSFGHQLLLGKIEWSNSIIRTKQIWALDLKIYLKKKRFPLNFVFSFDVMKACTTTLAQHKSSKTPSARANDLLEGATRKNLSRNPEKKSNFLNTIFLE